jgi:UDP-N-acetylglucosamine 2-epimerase (non-hydrolysing)
MPEEINRMVTDIVSDLLFATSPDAVENLAAEGVDRDKIHLVGNPMIDTVKRHLEAARARGTPARLGLPPGGYGVVTLHRPSNVDEADGLGRILEALRVVGAMVPVHFPVHPRTRARMEQLGFGPATGVNLCEPMGYLDVLGVMDAARFVLTDSGGIQEETTALGVPCLTLRANTERPITISEGTNRLLGDDPSAIVPAVEEIVAGHAPPARSPRLWDGRAGERIAAILARATAGAAPGGD